MYAFDYVRPSTLQDALAQLAAHAEAMPLSGGMTLLPTLKQKLAAPSHLVDIARLPELQGIAAQERLLTIGAGTRHVDMARSDVVARAIPALAHLARQIADPQVRNRGTLGGSVANNDPAADYPAAVLGLGAAVITDRRRVQADDFFVGMFTTALEPGELIVSIEFPLPLRAGYAKFRHPASGYAVVGVFIAAYEWGVRVAVTGAGPGVFRWAEAEEALTGDLSEAALAPLQLHEDAVLGDVHTSARHKAHLVQVIARRALAHLHAVSPA